MKLTWKQQVAGIFRRLGYDLHRFDPGRDPLARRLRLMETHGIEVLLDVGANEGQFATEMISSGYQGRVFSFEPQKDAHAALVANLSGYPRFRAYNIALGERKEKSTINISGNSASSSLLGIKPSHTSVAPSSGYVATEEIEVDCLNNIWPELDCDGRSVWLKIDTQGYEHKVLAGADAVLDRVRCVQLEMSLVQLYDDSLLFEDLFPLMQKRGFQLIGLETGFTDRTTGRLLQVEGIFGRVDA